MKNLTVAATGLRDEDLVSALKEVISKIEGGFNSGFDRNTTGNYNFQTEEVPQRVYIETLCKVVIEEGLEGLAEEERDDLLGEYADLCKGSLAAERREDLAKEAGVSTAELELAGIGADLDIPFEAFWRIIDRKEAECIAVGQGKPVYLLMQGLGNKFPNDYQQLREMVFNRCTE